MRRLPTMLVSFVFCLMCASFAGAHAFLDSAEPAVGSTVTVAPSVIRIWFTKHIKSAASSMQVFDSDEHEVDSKDAKVDKDDPTLMTVTVPSLAPGTYKVVWTAVCFDTHTTHGTYIFVIKP